MTWDKLGSVDPLYRTGPAPGFDYAGLVTRTRLIGDGSANAHNENLQSGALPNRTGQLSAFVDDATDMATLRGYAASSEVVEYTEADGLVHPVVVFELSATQQSGLAGGWWEVSLTLVEVGNPTEPPP